MPIRLCFFSYQFYHSCINQDFLPRTTQTTRTIGRKFSHAETQRRRAFKPLLAFFPLCSLSFIFSFNFLLKKPLINHPELIRYVLLFLPIFSALLLHCREKQRHNPDNPAFVMSCANRFVFSQTTRISAKPQINV